VDNPGTGVGPAREPLGRLNPIDLRAYWQDEAREFTPWLAESSNLKLLSEAIGIDLDLEGIEIRVGAFKADILAKEVVTGDVVLIENQLERTNHDHLGKLITYASGLGAKAVVWVAKEISEEHRKALDWLNEVTGESVAFFGIEVELWRIGDSSPAPRFNIISQPNEWARSLQPAATGGQVSEAKLLQLDFWKEFIEFCKERGTRLQFSKAHPQHWYTFAVGRSGFAISLTVNTVKKRLGCEIYIAHQESKTAFAELFAQREQIENELGASLEWQELPHRHASRIVEFRSGDIEERESRPELFVWLKERTENFHRVFSARIRALALADLSEEVQPE
jgi:uncharacterized protein YbjQ (UPF0145 family)